MKCLKLNSDVENCRKVLIELGDLGYRNIGVDDNSIYVVFWDDGDYCGHFEHEYYDSGFAKKTLFFTDADKFLKEVQK